MKVEFDIFLAKPELLETLLPDDIAALDMMKNFFNQRVAPFNDEIEKEELEKDSRCLYIRVMADEKTNPLRLNGYSKELAQKIKSCFSKEDYTYLANLIGQLIAAQNN